MADGQIEDVCQAHVLQQKFEKVTTWTKTMTSLGEATAEAFQAEIPLQPHGDKHFYSSLCPITPVITSEQNRQSSLRE